MSRCIVPFAVPLAARRGDSVLRLLSLLLSRSIVRLRVCGAVAFMWLMLRERSLDVKLWRLVSRRNSGLQWRGGIEFPWG